MGIEFKVISETDISRLAEIFYSCLHHDYQGVLPPNIIESFSDESSTELWRNSYYNQTLLHFLGAWDGDLLVGFAKYGADPEDPLNGYIASLYVDPDQAGQGIGSALLNYVLKELSSYPMTRLWAFDQNPRAIGLYEKLGFIRSGRTRTEAQWEVLQCEMVLQNSQVS
jgi:ribosomal protein S18 acetylase RimI-like enzyme